jgi:DNA-binding response OmpR family regulator
MRLALAGLERGLGDPVEFVAAENGERGLALVRREMPDLVVADEFATRMGAFGLARELRGAADPYQGLIVIVLERRHDEWLARWSGADAWFVKPVDPFALAERVRELVTAKEHA